VTTKTTSFIYKGQCGRRGGGEPHRHSFWIARDPFPSGEDSAALPSACSAVGTPSSRATRRREEPSLRSNRAMSNSRSKAWLPPSPFLPQIELSGLEETVKTPKARDCRGETAVLPPTARRGGAGGLLLTALTALGGVTALPSGTRGAWLAGLYVFPPHTGPFAHVSVVG